MASGAAWQLRGCCDNRPPVRWLTPRFVLQQPLGSEVPPGSRGVGRPASGGSLPFPACQTAAPGGPGSLLQPEQSWALDFLWRGFSLPLTLRHEGPLSTQGQRGENPSHFQGKAWAAGLPSARQVTHQLPGVGRGQRWGHCLSATPGRPVTPPAPSRLASEDSPRVCGLAEDTGCSPHLTHSPSLVCGARARAARGRGARWRTHRLPVVGQ